MTCQRNSVQPMVVVAILFLGLAACSFTPARWDVYHDDNSSGPQGIARPEPHLLNDNVVSESGDENLIQLHIKLIAHNITIFDENKDQLIAKPGVVFWIQQYKRDPKSETIHLRQAMPPSFASDVSRLRDFSVQTSFEESPLDPEDGEGSKGVAVTMAMTIVAADTELEINQLTRRFEFTWDGSQIVAKIATGDTFGEPEYSIQNKSKAKWYLDSASVDNPSVPKWLFGLGCIFQSDMEVHVKEESLDVSQ